MDLYGIYTRVDNVLSKLYQRFLLFNGVFFNLKTSIQQFEFPYSSISLI